MKNTTFNALVTIFIIIFVAVILAVFTLGNKTALAPAVPIQDAPSDSSDVNASSTSGPQNTPSIIFGQKVYGDLNKDDKRDSAYMFTQSPGGSGTFFYVTAELATNVANSVNGVNSANAGVTNSTGATTQTNSILLGDRIAPQNINIVNGKIVVNYADRKVGEPMVVQPSVGVTKYFAIENGKLVEVQVSTSSTTSKPTPSKPAPTKPTSTAGDRCTANGGTWSAQYGECGGVSSATCQNIGGTFDECASPCRHDPKATVCVAMCAQVCNIK